MSAISQADPSEGSEDVADFLRRIKELGDKRDKEDAERTRKLEEEIMEGRRQREARRAERTRSLSPEKQSPTATPSTRLLRGGLRSDIPSSPILPVASEELSTPQRGAPLNSPLLPETHALALPTEELQDLVEITSEVTKKPINAPPRLSPSFAAAPKRSGTVSWQQRPGSLRGIRSGRPTSLHERASPPRDRSSTDLEDPYTLKTNIVDNLGSKDASWFRQTPERIVGLPAYRHSQDDTTEVSNARISKQPLVGMSQNIVKDTNASSATTSLYSDFSKELPRSINATQDTTEMKTRRSPTNPLSASALPTRESQKFPPPQPYDLLADAGMLETKLATTTSSSVQHNFENVSRPISPTKGMGGFVQSAMLKRSDSMNKRWSVQTTSSFNRQDSGAISRSNLRLPQELSIRREIPNNENIRPQTPTRDAEVRKPRNNVDVTSKTLPNHKEISTTTPVSPSTLQLQKSQSDLPGQDHKDGQEEELNSPSSPSKRWSPVKSSWLESALSRPSSPQLPSTSPQPTWLSDLNKSKQERSSRDFILSKQVESTTKEPLERKLITMPTDTQDVVSRSTTVTLPPMKPKPVKLFEKAPEDISLQRSPTHLIDNQQSITSNPTHSSVHSSLGSKVPSTVIPKTDFRSVLKPSEISTELVEKEELEFRNVFGKLKRAHTGKYTPPDDLKENIIRGKEGLSTSMETRKSVESNGFKDHLPKRQNSVKAKSVGLNSSGELGTTSSQSQSLNTLKQSADSSRMTSQSGFKISELPSEFLSTNTRNMEKYSTKPTISSKPTIVPLPTQSESMVNSNLANRFKPGLASLLAKRTTIAGDTVNSPAMFDQIPDQARGDYSGVEIHERSNHAGQLQHMTKGRAKGPKRRLPKASEGMTGVESPATIPGGKKPTLPKRIASTDNTIPVKSSHVLGEINRAVSQTRSKPPTPLKSSNGTKKSNPLPSIEAVQTQSGTRSPSSTSSLPSRPAKPSSLRSPSETVSQPPETEAKMSTSFRKHSNDEQDSEAPALSVKDATAVWGHRTASRALDAREIKPQVTLSTFKDEQIDMELTPIYNTIETTKNRPTENFATKISPVPRNEPSVAKNQDLKYTKSKRSPPCIGTKSIAVSRSVSVSLGLKEFSPRVQHQSLAAQASKMSHDIINLFKETPKIERPLDIDIQDFLVMNPNSTNKIKTLRKQISQISSDGTTIPLPSHEDHVLFDRAMYICTHIFGDSTGARTTEVYLWAGSSVNDSSVGDAQVHAQIAAKDRGGKLIVFRQGKETSNFFQALGGILITRSGQAKDNRKPYMLCGRRHLGHIAFDEVEFSPTSLCSGFPFIIASPFNTIFLWKGSGCNPEELAGARLMSMDLGIDCRVVELDEGQELAEFSAMFPAGTSFPTQSSSNHWKLKAKNLNYNVRLFHVEHTTQDVSTVTALWNRVRQPDSAPKTHTQITEITPFHQADIKPENIYILDAFFELYIILGPLATDKPQAFTSALLFAQDYAIQAASNTVEDRPFVPTGTVILEGIPRDMKAAFRTWKEGDVETELLMTGRRKGEGQGVTRTVPLRDVIDAVRGM